MPGARDIADRLMASLGSMLLYWYHYAHNGRRIEVETDDDSIGGHFLHLLHGEPPPTSWVEAMHMSLILYAEHEFNASTFTARVIAGTGSDMYSAITGAHRRAARPEARRRQRGRVRDPEALRDARRGRSRHPPARREQGSRDRLRPSGLHDLATRATRSSRKSRSKLSKEAGDMQHVRHRRAPRDGDVGREEDVPEPRLVLGGQLSHDGRADRDVHAAVRDRAHVGLVART